MAEKRECPTCGKPCSVNKDGSLRKHACKPLPAQVWCEACETNVPSREDGSVTFHHVPGSYERVCDGSQGEPLPESPGPAPFGGELEPTAVEPVDAEATPERQAAIDFLSPKAVSAYAKQASTARTHEEVAAAFMGAGGAPEETEYLNASGQPRSKTNRHGYLITDPETGEYRRFKNGNIHGFTRCTTLVKASSDNKSLSDWSKRNVLMGAVKRPDVAARAFGKTHEDHKDELDEIVDTLEEIAGAKIAADQGTEFHEITERYDGGLLTLDQCPPFWRRLLEEYARVMDAYGFEPVPGLIERTTMTHEYGGVAGTGDRIHFHRPSQTYVVTDVKTGKGALDYGRREIPAQLAMYQKGYSTYGVYDWPKGLSWDVPQKDWPAGTWEKLDFPVRDDWGIVIHAPLQGDAAHTVALYPAPLDYGREVAQQCADIRRDRSAAPKFQTFDPALFGTFDWEARFRSVQKPEEASAAWQAAKAAGVSGLELNKLVGLAQMALVKLGYPSR